MEVSKEKLEGNKVKLNVEIEPERVNDALEQAYKKVVKDVSLPGFRKGKVPRKVLEANYGKEVLHKDALDILIPEAYQEAVKTTDIEPIDQPSIEDFYIAEDEPATFEATVEVKPEVELGQYTGFDIEKEEMEVSEEEIQEQIEQVRDQHSQLVYSDKETIEEGDYVILDYRGTIDGEEFPGGSAEEYGLEIGSGTFVPGFEEQLIGHQVGEEFEIDITFPGDYNAEDLAGQEAVFEVKIKEIKEKEKPELDDDFAREVSDFDTFEEYREDIKQTLQNNKQQQVEQEYENKLVEAIAEQAEVNLPKTLAEQELDRMYQNMSASISQQGLDVDDYLSYMGMDEEDWRDNNYEAAANRARNNLILEKIAEEEGIEADEEEVDSKIAEIAGRNDQDPEEVRALLQMQGQLENLKQSIKMEKVLDFLKENN